MSWNYRIVKRMVPSDTKGGKQAYYAIHEAFYDDKGRCYTITEEPVDVGGDSVSDVQHMLTMMKVDAIRRPVLDYDKVPEKGAVPPWEKKK